MSCLLENNGYKARRRTKQNELTGKTGEPRTPTGDRDGEWAQQH